MSATLSVSFARPAVATRITTQILPARARLVAVQPRVARVVAHAQAGYESDANEIDPYKYDHLTHSVSGEYEMGIFFLLAGALFLMPVIFPGSVLIVQSIFESMNM